MRVGPHPHALSLARSRSLGLQALPIHNQHPSDIFPARPTVRRPSPERPVPCAYLPTAARTLSLQLRASASTAFSSSVSILRSRITILPLTIVERTSSPRVT